MSAQSYECLVRKLEMWCVITAVLTQYILASSMCWSRRLRASCTASDFEVEATPMCHQDS